MERYSGASLTSLAKRRRILRYALFVSILALAAPVAAQPLSLAQALETAFAQNPELAAAQRGLGIAEGERLQAGVMPNPVLSWESEDTRRSTRTVTTTISQTLEIGGKRGARIETAEYSRTATQLDIDRQANALRAQVTVDWYAALRADIALVLARESDGLAQRGVHIAEGRVRAGKSSPVETTRAQVQAIETGLQVKRAENERANRYRDLARTLGMTTPLVVALDAVSPSPGHPPSESAAVAAVARSTDLRLAQAKIDQSDSALGLERARRIPDLTVSVGSQYDAAVKDRVNVVGFSLPLPLFDRNQGNVLAASRRAEQSRDLRNATELNVRARAQAALDQWSMSASEIDGLQRQVLPAARQAVDAATRGFELGKFGYLEVLDAQRTLIVARSQYLQALASATESRAALERLFGDLATLTRPL